MLRSLYRTEEGPVRTDLSLEAYALALEEPDAVLWVHLDGEPPEVCEPILRTVLGFRPPAVDGALKQSLAPKVDDWGTYLYVLLHTMTLERKSQVGLDTLSCRFRSCPAFLA
jgi:Mg2+ and Co2+ transporter CorA